MYDYTLENKVRVNSGKLFLIEISKITVKMKFLSIRNKVEV